MSVITTVKDKILKNSILARIFASGKDSRTRSCPGQENRETRTRFHPWGDAAAWGEGADLGSHWSALLASGHKDGASMRQSWGQLKQEATEAALYLNI